MAAFGLSQADYEDEYIEIYPDNKQSFEIFRAMMTQWRVGFNGMTGLDYNALFLIMKLHKVADELALFNDIQLMETSALIQIRKSQTA